MRGGESIESPNSIKSNLQKENIKLEVTDDGNIRIVISIDNQLNVPSTNVGFGLSVPGTSVKTIGSFDMVLWESKTGGQDKANGPFRLTLQPNGTLTATDRTGKEYWASKTNKKAVVGEIKNPYLVFFFNKKQSSNKDATPGIIEIYENDYMIWSNRKQGE